jgi:thioredoxin 1
MLDITESQLDKLNTGLAILDLWADWCAPCRPVTVVLNQLESEYKDIKIYKINVNENPNIAAKYGVYALPTVLGFKNGELIAQVVGAKEKNKFKEMFDLLMQN